MELRTATMEGSREWSYVRPQWKDPGSGATYGSNGGILGSMAFVVCHCRFLEFTTSLVADFTDTAPDQRHHFLGNFVARGFCYV